ncbi:EAL domain-containing protein [Roseateles sp. BYS180W]|uniref:EAL domain-containing protein n=1 Tax=Roseateles rivi TaxID=3299028 RepID=A0ABW7FTS5_9BURK
MPELTTQSFRRDTRRHWLGTGAVLGLCWAVASLWLHHERDVLLRTESDKLQAQVEALDNVLGQQLVSAHTALKTVMLQSAAWGEATRTQRGSELLSTLARSIPGVRGMTLVSPQGVVVASSFPEMLHRDVSQRDYFRLPSNTPAMNQLYLSEPYESAMGVYTVTLSRAAFNHRGIFSGVVAATLEPEYFQLVMGMAQPSANQWVAMAHEDGLLFGVLPERPDWVGKNMRATAGSILARHVREGELSSLQHMKSVLSDDERLVGVRTIKPEGFVLNKHLVVAVGRSVADVEAPWRRQVMLALLTGGAITLMALSGLGLWQRRRLQLVAMRQRQFEAEREAAQRTALALDGAALGLWDWHVSTDLLHSDARCWHMLGCPPTPEAVPLRQWLQHVEERDQLSVNEALQQQIAHTDASGWSQQFRMQHSSGQVVWIHAKGRATAWDGQGRALRIVATLLDITQARQTEQQLRDQASHTQAILDHMLDGVITTDASGVIESINPAACRMFGYPMEELLGRNVNVLMPLPDSQHHKQYIANYFSHGVARVIGQNRDVSGLRKDGTVFPMTLGLSQIEREGQPLFVGLTRDITERKQVEAEIERLAFYDALTELPNRRLLMDRLQHALVSARRHSRSGALLFIDLDHFKVLNDNKGHSMGDLMLKEVAQRIQRVLRADDTVARWGGDEFVVVLQDLGSSTEPGARSVEVAAEVAAEKLLHVLGQPYQLDGYLHHSTPSIGIVLWGGSPVANPEDLLKAADHAMYQAKSQGRNRICFFDPRVQAEMAERIALELDLRSALQAGELELHCQAQVGRSGQLIGGELLLRWRHPTRGWISPAVFIPLAEQTGLIEPLGQWVLRQTCELLGRWATDPLLAPLSLAVNLSVRQFRQKGFADHLIDLLQRSSVPAHSLKLEITESAVIEDVEAVIALMEQLRALGLRFSLDDFGTGYSSLAYLKRLPLAQLKIDQSFVRDLLTEANARAIAHAVIQMGNSLGLDVIAEGVETDAQHALLGRMGCHAFQGYRFARPVPLPDFERLVYHWNPAEAETIWG